MDKLNGYNGVADCGYSMISHASETCTQCDKPPSYVYSITTLRAPFQRSIFMGRCAIVPTVLYLALEGPAC